MLLSFIWPTMLFSLLLVPFLVTGYGWLLRRRERQTAVLGTMGFLQTSRGQQLGRRRHLPFAIFLLAISLLLVSFARPEAVVNLPRVEGTVILAFDVSGSMIADDLDPSRMEAGQSSRPHLYRSAAADCPNRYRRFWQWGFLLCSSQLI